MKSFSHVPSLFNALNLVPSAQTLLFISYTCVYLDVPVFVLVSRSYMMWLTPEVRELTCCHGDEYQPRTTALEAVLPGTARLSSRHAPRLHPCWSSTRGLAIFLHLRTGKSTYLHRKRHLRLNPRLAVYFGWELCSRCRKTAEPTGFWRVAHS